jgi:glutamate-ammonia-ligase adenylyltransferase
VQLLQLQHAAEDPALRVTSTVEGLTALRASGRLDADQAGALFAAWELATRARNGIFLVRGRPSDQLPRPGTELAGVARTCGYGPDLDAGQFVDDYMRTTRHARSVVDAVFYGQLAPG